MPTTPTNHVARSIWVGLSAGAVLISACSNGSETIQIPGVGSPENSTLGSQTNGTETVPSVATPTDPSEPTDSTRPPGVSTVPTERPSSTGPANPPTSPSTPTNGAPSTTVVSVVYYREGDEGPEIAVMQRKLITTAYLAPGSDSGVFDAATEAALRRFQGDYGLGADGVFGPLTNRSLTAAAFSVTP